MIKDNNTSREKIGNAVKQTDVINWNLLCFWRITRKKA